MPGFFVFEMNVVEIRLKRTGGQKWLKVTNEKGQFVRIPVDNEQISTLLSDIARLSPKLVASAVRSDDETIQAIRQLEEITNKLKSKLCSETSTHSTEGS